jgi:lipid II:glycine glycyltransferase (peptidoglycan interpeptide bridge formation enzyme)
VTGQREHFPIRIWEYYEKEWQILSKENCCILLMAFYENQLLAVRTAYCFGRHAAEFHAGSISYTSNLHPNYLLVWEAIQWAKKQGCVTYDLWGIPNEIGTSFCNGNSVPIVDRTDGLWGVYRFKSGFSKNIVAYVGAYDYVYQPQLYTFISNKIVRGDTLDRIMTWMDSIKHK